MAGAQPGEALAIRRHRSPSLSPSPLALTSLLTTVAYARTPTAPSAADPRLPPTAEPHALSLSPHHALASLLAAKMLRPCPLPASPPTPAVEPQPAIEGVGGGEWHGYGRGQGHRQGSTVTAADHERREDEKLFFLTK